MHGLWMPGGKQDTSERDGQAVKFAHILSSIAVDPGETRVACGDWNLLPESYTFEILRDTLRLGDLVASNGVTSTRTSHYINSPRHKGKPPESLFADYMCISPQVRVDHFEVIDNPEVSDHCPLVLDIE
jgi:endonuclease/exonuclease/phosphatase family metal-dependent hydrolase